jgi:hypothetical protein
MMIMVHFDSENYSLIPYVIKSTKAWLKRKKIKNPALDVFFHHAYAIAKAPGYKRRDGWLRLLEAVEAKEMESFDVYVRNLKSWINTKLSR